MSGTKKGGLNTAIVQQHQVYQFQQEEEEDMNTREQESDRRQATEKENNKEVGNTKFLWPQSLCPGTWSG